MASRNSPLPWFGRNDHPYRGRDLIPPLHQAMRSLRIGATSRKPKGTRIAGAGPEEQRGALCLLAAAFLLLVFHLVYRYISLIVDGSDF